MSFANNERLFIALSFEKHVTHYNEERVLEEVKKHHRLSQLSIEFTKIYLKFFKTEIW